MGNGNNYEGLDAYAVKIIRHKARQLAGRAGFVEADRHDIEQELALDLLRRLPRFNPALARREVFIARVIEHQVATLVESRKAAMRDYRCCAGSLDERRPGDDGDANDTPAAFDGHTCRYDPVVRARRSEELRELRIDLKKTIDGLPVNLRALCARLLTSSVSDVSRETGMPRGTLYESIAKLRTRFECAGLAVYLDRPDGNRKAPVCKDWAQKSRA